MTTENKKEYGKEVILAVAATFVSALLYHLAGKWLNTVIEDDFLHDFLAELAFAVFVVISVVLLKKKDIFRSDRTLLKSGWKSAGFLIFISILMLVMGLGNLLTASVTARQFLLLIGQLILVGFCEETLFRGLIQGSLHNYFGEDSRKHVMMAVVCGGVIFGLAHLINLDRGNPILAAVLQAGVNCFAGMLYCAVFFRTGKNLKFLIFIHAFYDFAAMTVNGRLNGESLDTVLNPVGDSLTLQSVAVGILFWGVVYLVPTLIVLRPKKVDPLLRA